MNLKNKPGLGAFFKKKEEKKKKGLKTQFIAFK